MPGCLKDVEFNSELFSDIRVRFLASLPPAGLQDGQATRREESDAPTYYAHKNVLACNSPALKTLLLRFGEEEKDREEERQQKELEAVRGRDEWSVEVKLKALLQVAKNTDPDQGCLDLPMEKDELLAAEMLLRFLYSGNFTGEVEQGLGGVSSNQKQALNKCKLLLQVYRLADRFEVQAALDACVGAMSKIKEQDLGELETITCIFSFYSSAPALWDHAPIQALRNRCMGQLVARLNAEWQVSPSGHLCEHLIPNFPAMHALACSDSLRLCSENDVVALINCWVRNNHPSTQQLVELSHAVRLRYLTPSYLVGLKQIAPWFQAEQDELLNVLVAASSASSVQVSYPQSPWYCGNQRGVKACSSTFVARFSGETMAYVFKRALDVGVGSRLDCGDVLLPTQWPIKGYQVSYYPVLERPADDEKTILFRVAVTVSPWIGWQRPLENYKGWHVPMLCTLTVSSGMDVRWCVGSDPTVKPVTAGEPWVCSTYIKIPLDDELGKGHCQDLVFSSAYNLL